MRLLLNLLFCVFALANALFAQGIITTIAGTDSIFIADGVQALQAKLSGTLGLGITTDTAGNVYIADGGNQAIYKVTPSGVLTTIAGNGIPSFAGDGGLARAGSFVAPQAVVADAGGNIYVADAGNNGIRKITKDGIITTIAGNGMQKYGGDGGAATAASISFPESLAIDAAGNLYVGSVTDSRIRKITPSGLITTVVGNGTIGFSGDGGPATSAQIDFPGGIAVDSAGNLYFADSSNYRIRRVTPAGIITTIAGGGTSLALTEIPATRAAIFPVALTFDQSGTLYFSDLANRRIAKLTSNDTIVTVAGNGTEGGSGDGGPPLNAALSNPASIAFDLSGNLYIADQALSVVRKVSSGGNIARFAGDGTAQFGGDSGPATLAKFNFPQSIALDPTGRLYIADFVNHRIRRLEIDGTVQTIAGTGQAASLGDGGDARSAALNYPAGIALDGLGNLYVSEIVSSRIRKITSAGIISTIAGTGLGASSGDNGPATLASISPTALEADSTGNLYVADAGSNRIRKIDVKGIITTYAGGGTALGDGGPAIRANLLLKNQGSSNGGLALDAAGNLYIADTYNHRIRMVTPAGIITTVAGNGKPGFSGDNGPAVNASLNAPFGIAIDSYGSLLIADQQNNRIRRVSAGIITTIAGDGRRDFKGDGGLAVNASLRVPSDVAADAKGNIFIADQYNSRIREILATPPTFDVQISALSFSARSGGAPSQPQLFVVNSPLPGLLFSVSTTTSGGGNWLTVTPQAGATPRRLEVSANPMSLQPGTYQGIITITAPNASPTTRTITVAFDVTPGPAPQLSVDKSSVSFTFPKASLARSEVIAVGNIGGGILNFNATVSTARGGNWLKISAIAGSASPVSPSILAITADPTGLTPGSYTGQVVISTAGESRTVVVNMTVSDAEKALLLTQTGLSFSAVANGGVVPPQTFGVLNVGAGIIRWTVTASTLSGGPTWLSVSPNQGNTETGTAAPLVEVRVNPAGLAAGAYYGLHTHRLQRGQSCGSSKQPPGIDSIPGSPAGWVEPAAADSAQRAYFYGRRGRRNPEFEGHPAL